MVYRLIQGLDIPDATDHTEMHRKRHCALRLQQEYHPGMYKLERRRYYLSRTGILTNMQYPYVPQTVHPNGRPVCHTESRGVLADRTSKGGAHTPFLGVPHRQVQ